MPRLRRRYPHRHVAIHQGQVMGGDASHDALFERLWKKLAGRTFFIGLVGDEPPLIELPGFEIRRRSPCRNTPRAPRRP